MMIRIDVIIALIVSRIQNFYLSFFVVDCAIGAIVVYAAALASRKASMTEEIFVCPWSYNKVDDFGEVISVCPYYDCPYLDLEIPIICKAYHHEGWKSYKEQP